MKKVYVHWALTSREKNSKKDKQRNTCRKNIKSLKKKKDKKKKKKKKKGKLHRTAKAQHRGRGL